MFLKMLFSFLTGILFHKDEYNVASKHFNPVRVIVTLFLVCNLFFTIYLLAEIVHMYDHVTEVCPVAADMMEHEEDAYPDEVTKKKAE